MIMVDVLVPSIGRQYNFNLEEQVPISMLLEEITEIICQKENCVLAGETMSLTLCSVERSELLSHEASLSQCGITNGHRLILV